MTWHVGDGTSCRFWEDHWLLGQSIDELAPAVHAMVPKRRRRQRTVKEGLEGRAWVQDIHGALGVEGTVQYVELWEHLYQFRLSNEPDQLTWKMTANGSISMLASLPIRLLAVGVLKQFIDC